MHYLQVPDLDTTWNMIDKGGVVALLFLGLIFLFLAFQFGWVVPAYVYKKCEDNGNEWKVQAKATLDGFKLLTDEVKEIRRASETRRAR